MDHELIREHMELLSSFYQCIKKRVIRDIHIELKTTTHIWLRRRNVIATDCQVFPTKSERNKDGQ